MIMHRVLRVLVTGPDIGSGRYGRRNCRQEVHETSRDDAEEAAATGDDMAPTGSPVTRWRLWRGGLDGEAFL
jgi:hypothetical protein